MGFDDRTGRDIEVLYDLYIIHIQVAEKQTKPSCIFRQLAEAVRCTPRSNLSK